MLPQRAVLHGSFHLPGGSHETKKEEASGGRRLTNCRQGACMRRHRAPHGARWGFRVVPVATPAQRLLAGFPRRLTLRVLCARAGIGPRTYRTYPVRSGESIEDIISKRSISRAEVDALNPEVNLDKLQGGGSPRVPAAQARPRRVWRRRARWRCRQWQRFKGQPHVCTGKDRADLRHGLQPGLLSSNWQAMANCVAVVVGGHSPGRREQLGLLPVRCPTHARVLGAQGRR